jgi:hypothetical protein
MRIVKNDYPYGIPPKKNNADKLRHIIAGIENLVSETETTSDEYDDDYPEFNRKLRGNILTLLIDIGAISYDGTTYTVNI